MKLSHALLAPLAAVVALSALARLFAEQEAPAPPKPVAVFLLRHAETAEPTGSGGDPQLSDKGKERALDLAQLLGKSGATHLFATEFTRTQSTLAPLADKLGLAVEKVPAGEAARQAELLRALPPGSVAVVAGHSNTIPALVESLGGEIGDLTEHPTYGKVFDHDSYDRLVQVTLPVGTASAAQTIELRYGGWGIW